MSRRTGDRRPTSEPGLFAPSSVTWRLHTDSLMGVAGLRALLLEALHPAASALAHEDAVAREEVWRRLDRRADLLAVASYGSAAEALVTAARARAVLACCVGDDPVSGRTVRADDPDLLAWAHVCRVDSVLDVLARGGADVGPADPDRYVEEQVRTASLLGLEPDEVPHDVAGLRHALEEARPLLAVTRAAREDAAYVVDPPVPHRTVPGLPDWSSVAGLAFAALPSWARSTYGLERLPGAAGLHDAATTIGLRTLRASQRSVRDVDLHDF